MMTTTAPAPRNQSLSWPWLGVTVALVAAMAVLRLVIYRDDVVPLTYVLPLLLALWHRDRRLLWAMAAGFMLISIYKAALVPDEDLQGMKKIVFLLMQLTNIIIGAAVIHGVIYLTGRLEQTVQTLEQTNNELEASNEELAAREEEISQQNEELQSQAAEVEQQMEELNAQTEELQTLNEQLAARERTLNDLLETSIAGASESEMLQRLGEMVERLLGPRAGGAAVLEAHGTNMKIRPLFGLAPSAGDPAPIRRDRTLAELVMTKDAAGFVADMTLRPDLETPALSKGGTARSVLAAPLRVLSGTNGALEVYSVQGGEWREQELRVVQWLAEQCGRLWSNARLREELAGQSTFLRTVTDSATSALFMADAQGRCTYMNPAAEKLIGVPWDDAKERHVHDLVHAHTAGASHTREACPLVSPGVREDVLQHRRGEDVAVACVTTPVSRDGGAFAVLIEARDIRDQKRIVKEREELLDSERAARGEAERASRAKDEFVANLSHELRTPLNAVLGWATLLRKGSNDPAEVAKGMEVIERNARHQAQLIADLLDISRITAGKIRLDVQPVDLPLAIEAAIDTVRPTAESKGVRIDKIIEPVDRTVMGDPGRLQQIVWNLLTNAVKFTPRGGRVQVVVSRVASYVQIAVSDTGQGISPTLLPHLFERYRQGDATATRRQGGLGLGLAIVKHLVELHGGTIHARSEGEGKGSEFAVLLPVRAVEPVALEDESSFTHPATPAVMSFGPDTPTLEGLNVVVVDDEEDARTLISRILAGRGARVHPAASADEALAVIEQHKPNLIVSDIGMPGTDGYTLIRRIRAERPETAAEMPAIALTAFARSEDRTRALLAGFQSHISKPVEAAELVATVASLRGTLRSSERKPSQG